MQSHIDTDVLQKDSAETDLLFIYDCETTGLSIYNDHITQIAAKVIGVPSTVTLSQASFTSLVHTPRYISKKGNRKTY